jgi:hypothetical protein
MHGTDAMSYGLWQTSVFLMQALPQSLPVMHFGFGSV